jgi:hypothetical protein
MTPEAAPVSPDEFVIRCVWGDYFDLALPLPVLPRAFLPRPDEKDGISVFRRDCLTGAEQALDVFDPAKRDRYALVLLAVADLDRLGLTVEPAPIPTVPGHAVLPELNVVRCKTEKKWCDGTRKQLAVLASQNVVRRPVERVEAQREVSRMDHSFNPVRWTAGDDQKLQVFKEFYLGADTEQRCRLYEYIRAVAALSPPDLEGNVQFSGEIGCTGDRVLSVEVSCCHLPDGPSATVDPHLLQAALEAWNRGEEFTPPPLIQ